MARYQVVIERDVEGGAWMADVVDIPGLHTQARTLRSLRVRTRELLEDWFERPLRPDEEIVEDLTRVLSASGVRVLDEAVALRQRLDEVEGLARAATGNAARALVAEGLAMRDAADLLGVSHQRVAQLVD